MLKITVSARPIRATIIRSLKGAWCFRDDNGKIFCEKNCFAHKEYAVNVAFNTATTEIA